MNYSELPDMHIYKIHLKIVIELHAHHELKVVNRNLVVGVA